MRSALQFRGRYWYPRHKKWCAKISIDGRKLHLGYFDTAELAARAFDGAARRYEGEGAAVNFPKGGSAERQATSRREMATSRHRPVKTSRSTFTHWG